MFCFRSVFVNPSINCLIGVLIVIGKLFDKITLDRCCPNELIQISGHSVVGCDERGISRDVELRPSGPTEDLLDIILRSTFSRIARCRRRFLRLRLRGASPSPPARTLATPARRNRAASDTWGNRQTPLGGQKVGHRLDEGSHLIMYVRLSE